MRRKQFIKPDGALCGGGGEIQVGRANLGTVKGLCRG